MSQPILQHSPRLTDTISAARLAVVLAVSGVVILEATRNTATWYLQQFWGDCGDFWESLWGKVCDLLHEDEWAIGCYGSFLFGNAFFWLCNAFFIFVDVFRWPKFVLRYKIQPNETFTMAEFWRACRVVISNQILVGGFVCSIVPYLWKWRGGSFGRDQLPTFHWVLFEFTVFALVEELGFYYTHRLAHSPPFYKYIHKRHHEWQAPIGIVSIYAHPLEHLFSNMMPIVAGPLLMGSHIATLWLWLAVATFSTTIAHCGYHLPFLPSPEQHDFHHLKFVNCFGVLGILDRLHGTDAIFRTSKQFQRHYLFFSLTPPRILVPDDDKKAQASAKPTE